VSHVLEAMNVQPQFAAGTIRFSWGRLTSEEDVRDLVDRLGQVLTGLRPRP